MRDHTKLRAFELADRLALETYEITGAFPKDEQYGLTAQIRPAVVSIASNIVEGCARNTTADYLHFIDMAYGSSRELQYQLSLARRLNYVPDLDWKRTENLCDEVTKVLNGLIRALRR